MVVYRILHKPTGLYYKPSRSPEKKNLSESGKIYTKKPGFKLFPERDWKLEKYTLVVCADSLEFEKKEDRP